MYLNRWILEGGESDDQVSKELSKFSTIIKKVLQKRGFSNKDDIYNFLHSDQCRDPLAIKDMSKAVDRINLAIENEEKIIIYGDYDVDGLTSTAVLYLYLSSVGADVDYYIPSREAEGYGLNSKRIEKLSGQYQLIITVDNGITAIDEIQYANSLGMDVVVTDHHKQMEVLPDACAIVDPHRNDCDSGYECLSGVGVVFKLISALSGEPYRMLADYADIIALGTVADVVPMEGENRYIVKKGLDKMRNNPNIGIKALMKMTGVDCCNISSADISFKLAPKLNSASRMGQADLSLKLLLSEDYCEVDNLVKKIINIDAERKSIERKMMEDIDQMISEDSSLVSDNVVVISREGWNHSISGINASKIVEKYHKPCILISVNGEYSDGSGRSIESFSLIDAINYCKDDLFKYGGHTLAVGLTLKTENIESFINHMREYTSNLDMKKEIKSYSIDCGLDLKDITVENVDDLKLLEPYGLGNKAPLFLIKGVVIESVAPLSNGKYLKMVVKEPDAGKKCEMLAFQMRYDDFIYKEGDKVDVLVLLSLNTFRGKVTTTVSLKDIRYSDFDQDRYFKEVEIYDKFRNSEDVDKSDVIGNLPDRQDVAVVYRYLKNILNSSWAEQNDLTEYLFIKLFEYNFSYIKISFILEILQDMGLIKILPKVTLIDVGQKMSIDDSSVYKRLLSYC